MKRSIIFVIVLLCIALISGCGSPAEEQPTAPAAATGDKPVISRGESTGSTSEPDSEETEASLSVDEAREILQAWVDSHPFQLGAELEAGSDDYALDGAPYYRFYLGIVRLGVAEILVDKETGALFHLTSPYASVDFAPIDEWYSIDHASFPQPQILTEAEARGLLQAWLDVHPLTPPATIAPEYDEHIAEGVDYYLFALASTVDYYPLVLVNRQSGALSLVFVPEDLGPPVVNWPPDDWYAEHFGGGLGEVAPADIGDAFYQGISIRDILHKAPEDVLGQPLHVEEVYYSYDGLEIYYIENYEKQVSFFDLSMVTVAGETLNKSRAELISLLGEPIEYYEYADYTYNANTADADARVMRYHAVGYYDIVYQFDFWFSDDDLSGKPQSLAIRELGQ